MILSVPAKTFLLGEYVALDGGPSILLSTEPRFELRVRAATATAAQTDVRLPFHPQSPAGLYFDKHRDDLSAWSYEFRDPSGGKGGLGASSAQFALLYAFQHDGEWRGGVDTPWASVLKDYRECAWNGEGVPPSGADIVSQLSGGVTWFDGRSLMVESITWPFPELGFTLLRTGHKLTTHEHLRAGTVAPYEVLRTIVLEARKAFTSVDDLRLVESVNACALALRQSGLTATATTDLLDQMRDNHELFYAAKGCGAMGADIILALHARATAPDVSRWAAGRGLEVCGSHETLSSGLEKFQDLPKPI